ncbi:MAG: ABC transporter ATP-binding protein [Candidatus Sumerlaeia bacterium]|nr:ABC transporter ATP-binding protein [Candidatus Sumerlaeia bacterium]
MTDPVVDCHDASVTLGEFQALRDVTMALDPGSFLAVMGPNGAGKSTFMKALMGLVPLSGGSITVLGNRPGEHVRREIGYIPQIKTLDRNFPALPMELVLTGLRGTWPWRITASERETAHEAMKIAGVDHRIGVPIGKLSGGELQRVYLARAFVREPKIVLLDEPATGMDRRGEADMYSVLDKYRSKHGATVIMITHDWEAAHHHATQVLLLDRGMIGYGAPGDVLVEDNMRRAFGHVGHHHSMTIPISGDCGA